MPDQIGTPIGILGGTYNPVHHGHLRVAVECLELLDLARLHLIPLNAPAHRDPPSVSAKLRLKLLKAAVKREKKLIADDREIRRGGVSYSVETLEEIRVEMPDRSICLIIGTDAFVHLHKWSRWEKLIELAHMIVVHRPGTDLPKDTPAYKMLIPRLTENIADLHRGKAGQFMSLSLPMLDISSTQIRSILHNKASPRYLLPQSVLKLIQKHELYL